MRLDRPWEETMPDSLDDHRYPLDRATYDRACAIAADVVTRHFGGPVPRQNVVADLNVPDSRLTQITRDCMRDLFDRSETLGPKPVQVLAATLFLGRLAEHIPQAFVSRRFATPVYESLPRSGTVHIPISKGLMLLLACEIPRCQNSCRVT